jgi:hypothetical protein
MTAMIKTRIKTLFTFALGMLTFALIAFIVKISFFTPRPEKARGIEDWEQICLWQEQDDIYLTVSPKGCYSTTCTQIKHQTGTAVLNSEKREIHLAAQSILLETSSFPFPCAKNCFGGGWVQFKFDHLIPGNYTLWFLDQKVGKVDLFLENPTPHQCFDNASK